MGWRRSSRAPDMRGKLVTKPSCASETRQPDPNPSGQPIRRRIGFQLEVESGLSQQFRLVPCPPDQHLRIGVSGDGRRCGNQVLPVCNGELGVGRQQASTLSKFSLGIFAVVGFRAASSRGSSSQPTGAIAEPIINSDSKLLLETALSVTDGDFRGEGIKVCKSKADSLTDPLGEHP